MTKIRNGTCVGESATASGADEEAFAQLSRRLLQQVPASLGAVHDVLLVTQAFDDPTVARCPALRPDRSCGVHLDRKPAACRVAPLDAFVPDRAQQWILADRAKDAESWGEECITVGARPDFAPLTRRLAVVDNIASLALAERRRDLEDERRFWGHAVLQMLHGELFSTPARFERIPSDGFFVLSLAPVLLVVARASEPCRLRCLQYLDAQLVLGQRGVAELQARGRHALAPARELGAFVQTAARLRSALAATSQISNIPTAEGRATERWLGITRTREGIVP